MAELAKLQKGVSTMVTVLVLSVEKREGKKGTFYTVSITDGKSDRKVNFFSQMPCPEKNDVIDIVLKQNDPYLNVESWTLTTSGLKPEDLKKSTPEDPQKMMADLREWISKMDDRKDVQQITSFLVEMNAEKLVRWSGGKSIHHNVEGGLLYHVWRMAKTAIAVSEVYGLDKTLLVSGVILHDIGKLKELNTDENGAADYTIEGNLFGHLAIGLEMLDDACRMLGVDRNKEEVMLLRHEIASHHGTKEKGAITEPKTAEAYVLSEIDNMDSRLWTYQKADYEGDPGTMVETTGGVDPRRVYVPSDIRQKSDNRSEEKSD